MFHVRREQLPNQSVTVGSFFKALIETFLAAPRIRVTLRQIMRQNVTSRQIHEIGQHRTCYEHGPNGSVQRADAGWQCLFLQTRLSLASHFHVTILIDHVHRLLHTCRQMTVRCPLTRFTCIASH